MANVIRSDRPIGKQLHLNANVIASGRHNAAWRLQGSTETVVDIDHFTKVARIAERGTLDAVFLADHLALDDEAKERPWRSLDPAILLAGMASATERIGLVATASTTFDHPYHIARRFASLDHISGGRAAWNVVTTNHRPTAANFGLVGLPEHADRYRRADEFVDVVTKLWDSWEEGAVVADKRTGQYIEPSSIRDINHSGEYFSVRGPLNVPRSPQGRPVIFQAGSSSDSKHLGARRADALFTVQRTLEEACLAYDELKSLVAHYGRNPDHVVVLPGLYLVVGSTEAEALARKEQLDAFLDLEKLKITFAERFGYDAERLHLDQPLPRDILNHTISKGSQGFAENIVREAEQEKLTLRQVLLRSPGHRILVGSPEYIADEMEIWFRRGAADGFNVSIDESPAGWSNLVDYLVPELRRRGLFRHEYSGSTLRDHLGISRFAPVSRARR